LIRKPLDQLVEADFVSLMQNDVSEGVSIEYKKELILNDRDQKAEFLADVISLANSGGGDLLIGIDEEKGMPSAIPGIEVPDQDKLGLQVESICRDKIEPRISGLRTQFVELENGRFVFVLRVAPSWNGPHRNMYDRHFYMRNSRGKAPMDVSELRSAFTQTMQASERIRNFRATRLAKIIAKKTPVAIKDGLTMVLHIAPISAVTGNFKIDIDQMHFGDNPFIPLKDSETLANIPNLDGRVSYLKDGEDSTNAYTQIFRQGLVESVVVLNEDGDEKILREYYEKQVKRGCDIFISSLAKLGLDGPVVIMLSFLNARETALDIGKNSTAKTKLNENELILPDVMLEPGAEIDPLLVTLYRMVWNGFGRVRPSDR